MQNSLDMRKGRFIVLYGIAASGKTTQMKLIGKWLKDLGYDVLLTKEPTNSEIGILLKRIVRGERNFPRRGLVYLFIADRMDHVENVIKPALNDGKIVICERYYLDTIAYQMLEGYSKEFLEKINIVDLYPDMSIFLDISVEESIKRMERLSEVRKIYEKRDILEKVRKNFLRLIEEYNKTGRDRIIIVNGERPIEDVFEEIKEKIKSNM